MDEQGDESWEPATKRARFAKPKTSPERQEAAVGVVPKNTHNSSQWALQNFNTWATNRSSLGHPVPERLLESHDAKLLCKYLSLYVMETRREDGKPYHPSTIRVLLSGINRILQANKAPFSVLDKSNPDFRDFDVNLIKD